MIPNDFVESSKLAPPPGLEEDLQREKRLSVEYSERVSRRSVQGLT